MKLNAIRTRFLVPLTICVLAVAGPLGCGGGTKVVSLTDPAYSSRPAAGGETTFAWTTATSNTRPSGRWIPSSAARSRASPAPPRPG